MSKYFVEKQEEKILLSKFIEMIGEGSYEGHLSHPKEVIAKNVGWVMDDLTDVELPISIISELYGCFHRFGGRYDVRSESDTIKGLYSLYSKYPKLSGTAIDAVSSIYIKDLFDEYDLENMLGKFISVFGETDEAFEVFYNYVEKKADELQVIYDDDAKKLEEYKLTYEPEYIEYLQGLIKYEHLSLDKIIASLPSPELVKTDKEQLRDISASTRIYFGVGYPISYSLTKRLVKDKDSLSTSDELYYVINNDKKVPATFTTAEFLESVKENQKIFSKKSE